MRCRATDCEPRLVWAWFQPLLPRPFASALLNTHVVSPGVDSASGRGRRVSVRWARAWRADWASRPGGCAGSRPGASPLAEPGPPSPAAAAAGSQTPAPIQRSVKHQTSDSHLVEQFRSTFTKQLRFTTTSRTVPMDAVSNKRLFTPICLQIYCSWPFVGLLDLFSLLLVYLTPNT